MAAKKTYQSKIESVGINKAERLFVISEGDGYTCLGFDVCQERTNAIARELNFDSLYATEVGTYMAYAEYLRATEFARKLNAATGRVLQCGLTPQLIGLEGKRVEVVDRHGDKRRFTVGRSTGWIPCHLEIANSRSHGGSAVTGAPFTSVVVVSENRRHRAR